MSSRPDRFGLETGSDFWDLVEDVGRVPYRDVRYELLARLDVALRATEGLSPDVLSRWQRSLPHFARPRYPTDPNAVDPDFDRHFAEAAKRVERATRASPLPGLVTVAEITRQQERTGTTDTLRGTTVPKEVLPDGWDHARPTTVTPCLQTLMRAGLPSGALRVAHAMMKHTNENGYVRWGAAKIGIEAAVADASEFIVDYLVARGLLVRLYVGGMKTKSTVVASVYAWTMRASDADGTCSSCTGPGGINAEDWADVDAEDWADVDAEDRADVDAEDRAHEDQDGVEAVSRAQVEASVHLDPGHDAWRSAAPSGVGGVRGKGNPMSSVYPLALWMALRPRVNMFYRRQGLPPPAPSREQMTQDLGVHPETLRRRLATMEEAGLVERNGRRLTITPLAEWPGLLNFWADTVGTAGMGEAAEEARLEAIRDLQEKRYEWEQEEAARREEEAAFERQMEINAAAVQDEILRLMGGPTDQHTSRD